MNEKCRILALGGGSDKGAYTAGAVIGLISTLEGEESHYDIVTGNGDGAINAFIISQHPIGDEASAAKQLDEFWVNFKSSDFYSNWLGWYITGLFYRSGLYDASNMYKTISKLSTGSFGRVLSVGTTDLITAGYVSFNSTKLSVKTMETAVAASAAKGGIFPYVRYGDFKLIDGTIKFSVDIQGGLNYCSSIGYKDEAMVVDIVLSNSAKLPVIDPESYNSIQNLMRFFSIQSYNGVFLAIEDAKLAHPKVAVRHLIYPSEAIPDSLFPYDYSQSALLAMLNLGIKDGKSLSVSY